MAAIQQAMAVATGSIPPSGDLLFKTDREKFFALLTHDDRSSRYIISTDEGGEWRDIPLDAAALPRFRFNPRANYYVTRNGFTGNRRLGVGARQLNSIFLDVDFHDRPSTDCDALVSEVLDRISSAVAAGDLPDPTMIVSSGRGVHLYYVLQRSVPYRLRGGEGVNEQGVSYFTHVQVQLAEVLDEILSGIAGAKVDRAVFDLARVSRIPDTYNAKAGRYARLVSAREAFYHLPDLDAYKPTASRHLENPRTSRSRRAGVRIKFDKLILARLGKVVELQEHRGFNCEGQRELMCFVYYNSAVQAYEREDAWKRLLWFNSRFLRPLPESELRGIERAVSSVVNVKGERGYYVLGAETVARLLGLTEDEDRAIGFFASKRTLERMEAKRRTAEKRRQRDERIIALREEGRTRAEIAEEVGASLGTIHSVLKAAGLTRTNKRAVGPLREPVRHVDRVAARHAVKAPSPATPPAPVQEGPSPVSLKSSIIWHTCFMSSEYEEREGAAVECAPLPASARNPIRQPRAARSGLPLRFVPSNHREHWTSKGRSRVESRMPAPRSVTCHPAPIVARTSENRRNLEFRVGFRNIGPQIGREGP